MRGFRRSWAVLLILGLPAFGQMPTGLRGPGGELGGFNLVGEPAVQHELGMDQAQIKKAEPFVKKMNARLQADMSKLKGLGQDDLAKRIPSLAKPHYEEGMKGLSTFLKPEQIDRFDQILLQERGPMAMLEPEIAKAIQLTNAQAKDVAGIVADARNKQTQLIKEKQGDTKAAGPELRSIAKQAVSKADEVLKPEQLRTWKKIYGKPISAEAEAKVR